MTVGELILDLMKLDPNTRVIIDFGGDGDGFVDATGSRPIRIHPDKNKRHYGGPHVLAGPRTQRNVHLAILITSGDSWITKS